MAWHGPRLTVALAAAGMTGDEWGIGAHRSCTGVPICTYTTLMEWLAGGVGCEEELVKQVLGCPHFKVLWGWFMVTCDGLLVQLEAACGGDEGGEADAQEQDLSSCIAVARVAAGIT